MATFPTAGSRYTPPLDAHRILLAEELSDIAERAESFTGSTGVMIALRRSNELVVRTSNGIAPEVGACIPLPSGVTGLCVTTKKPQTCASADAEAQLEAVFRAIRVRSVLSVPVQWDGEVRGVLAVLSQTPEAFNRTHIAILMTLRDVIANKLSQCELPCDPPRQTVPAQPIEIDVDSLLNAPALQPAVVAPKPAAPAPRKLSAVPAPTAASDALPRVEPALALPASVAEPKLPVAAPVPQPKPLAELLKEPAEAPVEMSPDVLSPSEDPSKYGSVQKPKLVVSPVVCATATAVDAPAPMFAVYHPPAKSKRKHIPLFVGSAAAVVLLGLAVVFYPWHKSPTVPTPVVTATENPVPTPAPSLIAVPLPKSYGEHPPAPSKPPAFSTPAPLAKREEAKPAAEEPKRPVETASAPVLHLAPGKPVEKSEEPIEPPAPGLLAASGMALPALPAVSAPAVSLHKSVLVPATLVQGRTPQYPDAAKRMGLSGVVKVHISISADGKVTDVTVLTGNPLFRQASIAAVRDWLYRPAHLDGKPVPSTTDVSLRFTSSR